MKNLNIATHQESEGGFDILDIGIKNPKQFLKSLELDDVDYDDFFAAFEPITEFNTVFPGIDGFGG